MRRSSRLAVPLKRPEDVIPHLGKPTHWRAGRSAKALADAWFRAGDIPRAVRNVLMQSDYLGRAEFLDGWLERETDLRDSRGSPSQTDLLALLGVENELAVLGVEAKVDESFGPIVSKWLSNDTGGKTHRLQRLCTLFKVRPEEVAGLRYQLLHRTAAVILEARRFRSGLAIMTVHSFCPNATGLTDCTAFFDLIGMPGLARDGLVGPRKFGDVLLWAGWACDSPFQEPAAVDAVAETGAI